MADVSDITQHKAFKHATPKSEELVIELSRLLNNHLQELSVAEVVGALEILKMFYFDAVFYGDNHE